MPRLDLAGQRFGRLVAIMPIGKNKSGGILWKCKCDCGNECIAPTKGLKSGHKRSCGCLHLENYPPSPKKHGEFGTKLYAVWSNMIQRCINPNYPRYKNYGGRGIEVCDEWRDYAKFSKWAKENGYDQKLQIDRINNNGNYCPDNCRFVTARDNCYNRRSTVYVEIQGIKMNLKEVEEKYNVPRKTVYERYKRGKRGLELVI